ncbi:MAG: FkbM family methyltransferase [Acidobacteria bacterium]|nr:FkbM family methyltransferase [Acidobacteriota bacterium]
MRRAAPHDRSGDDGASAPGSEDGSAALQQERADTKRWKTKADAVAGELREAAASVKRWKALAAAQRQRADDSDARVRYLEERLEDTKFKNAQNKRHILSKQVLRDILELRARTLPARARIPPPAEREAALRAISPAYAAASALGPAAFGEHVRSMTVQGLQWWMPIVSPQPSGPSAAWVAKQHFPYRALTQTREVAIGGIMIDLGANTGRMSIPRVVLGDVVAAYCAEPDPLNYACLVGNIVDNGLSGLLLPDQVAIGDRDGSVLLHRSKVSGGHRILPAAEPSEKTVEVVEVPCRTLDGWLADLRVDLDAVTFVKVDVQGYETRVLAGASALLARRQVAWQLEVQATLLGKTGTSVPDLCAKLQQHFTHFIDLNGELAGPRQRPISELGDGLAYVDGGSTYKTDVLVYSAS